MKMILFSLSLLLSLSAVARPLKVATYNVANLYDTQHDVGTEDWTYLPLSLKQTLPELALKCASLGSASREKECLSLDWNEVVYQQKLTNIAKVISLVGADIVILQEIENESVLQDLRKKTSMPYAALVPGDDSRGIDVAFLSHYPIESIRHHSIFHAGKKLDTRGISEIALNVNDAKVIIFGNHWPSQSNPNSERLSAAELLESLIKNSEADLVLAAGDFNTISTDSPSPYARLRSLIDVETEGRRQQTQTLPPGTRYKKGWASIDKIFYRPSESFSPIFHRYLIVADSFLMDETGIPLSFDPLSGQGYSDHLPVVMTFWQSLKDQ
jgi:endonuclease/exonuclease/phosphatase family metal-dependent hydrolase